MSIFDVLATKEQKQEKQRQSEAAERRQILDSRRQILDALREDVAAMVEGRPHNEKRLASEYHTVADLEMDCDSYRNCKAKHDLQESREACIKSLDGTVREIRELSLQIRADLGPENWPPLIKERERTRRNLAEKTAKNQSEWEDYQAWREAVRVVEDTQDRVQFLEAAKRRLTNQADSLEKKINAIDATFDNSSEQLPPLNFSLSIS